MALLSLASVYIYTHAITLHTPLLVSVFFFLVEEKEFYFGTTGGNVVQHPFVTVDFGQRFRASAFYFGDYHFLFRKEIQ